MWPHCSTRISNPLHVYAQTTKSGSQATEQHEPHPKSSSKQLENLSVTEREQREPTEHSDKAAFQQPRCPGVKQWLEQSTGTLHLEECCGRRRRSYSEICAEQSNPKPHKRRGSNAIPKFSNTRNKMNRESNAMETTMAADYDYPGTGAPAPGTAATRPPAAAEAGSQLVEQHRNSAPIGTGRAWAQRSCVVRAGIEGG